MLEIIVYTKKQCPYCESAKNLLRNKNLTFEERLLTNSEEMLKLKQQTGWMTFPQIFINGKLIGGYTDLAALDQKGELDKIIKS